ncbi:hypothetical protein [Herbidospora daliensis]|uniref:hypothetical protein n=1 Tax=Herbidospora daliensis TaxID=295585 RepID=UPI0007861ECE|nr:hypothetical protein [Herbidospora daliensis]
MPGDRPQVLLLSSNHRRRYAEDILSALALPRGAVIQFRYDAEYVAPRLREKIANGTVVTTRCLLAFVADVETDAPFMVPVRFATVVSAESVADVVLFRLQVEDYPSLDEFPTTETEIRGAGKRFVDTLIQRNGQHYFPAASQFADLHCHEPVGTDPQSWLGVARRLARHDEFAKSYFVRVEPPRTPSGKTIKFDASGQLSVSDRQPVKIRVNFFSADYSESPKQLTCATDGTYLRISSDDSYDVALRYDSVEFWLQPAVLSFDALARVTVKLSADRLTTNAGFPVVVRRSRSRLALRLGASGLGAILVALPAVLGSGVALEWRLLPAVAGAVLLALSTVVISRGEK